MATGRLSDDVQGVRSAASAIWPIPAVACFALAMVSRAWTDNGFWLEWGVGSAAWALFVAGAGLRWSSAVYRGAMTSDLRCSGPFAISRQAGQIGALVIAYSLALFMQSATLAVGITLAALLYSWGRGISARDWLTSDFGSKYADDRRRSRAFRLRPGSFNTSDIVQTDLCELAIELRYAAIWIWVPVAGRLLAHTRSEEWWPHLLRLL